MQRQKVKSEATFVSSYNNIGSLIYLLFKIDKILIDFNHPRQRLNIKANFKIISIEFSSYSLIVKTLFYLDFYSFKF